MAEEPGLATQSRREILGEILRKVEGNNTLLLDIGNGVGELKKELSGLRADLVSLRGDLRNIVASTVSTILREELSRRKV
jgi:hypothetical protein